LGGFRCSLGAETLGDILEGHRRRALIGMGVFIPTSLLLISWLWTVSLSSKMFDALKTVLAAPVWTLLSKCWLFSSANIQFRLMATVTKWRSATQGVHAQGDVMPPKMSYYRTDRPAPCVALRCSVAVVDQRRSLTVELDRVGGWSVNARLICTRRPVQRPHTRARILLWRHLTRHRRRAPFISNQWRSGLDSAHACTPPRSQRSFALVRKPTAHNVI